MANLSDFIVSNESLGTAVVQGTATAGSATWNISASNTWLRVPLSIVPINQSNIIDVNTSTSVLSTGRFYLRPGHYITTLQLQAASTNITLAGFRLFRSTTDSVICRWTNVQIGDATVGGIQVPPVPVFKQVTGFTLSRESNLQYSLVTLQVLAGISITFDSYNDGDYQLYAQLTLDKIG